MRVGIFLDKPRENGSLPSLTAWNAEDRPLVAGLGTLGAELIQDAIVRKRITEPGDYVLVLITLDMPVVWRFKLKQVHVPTLLLADTAPCENLK